jgi:acyl-CoA thioesterase I
MLVYLNRAYAYFYDSLGKNRLNNPNTQTLYILNNPAGHKSTTYMSLGDSLTAGVGANSYQESLPYYHAQALISSEYSIVKLINLAVPGATIKDLIQNQIPQTIKEKPQYITILIGINDIHNFTDLNEFEVNYTKAVTELKDKTGADITIYTIPYLGSSKIVLFPFNILLNLKTQQFNNSIKLICQVKSVTCIDLYKASLLDEFIKDPTVYSSDNFHPSGKGYKLFSQYQKEHGNY